MSALNRPDNFAGRVNYAAAVISNGRATSRAFDNCFENWDGDEVCAVLIRRAENNPRLAANLFRYINENSAKAAAERLKTVPTRDIPKEAAKTRARCKAKSDAAHNRHLDEQQAICQRGKDAGYRVEEPHPFQYLVFRPDGSSLNSSPYSHENSAWYFAGVDAGKTKGNAPTDDPNHAAADKEA